jgi:NADH:quinone reductase (non-electrogenic)
MRRRVVIVGGGFGGLTAARALRRADVDVTLVDPKHHHLFQPLIYQVAMGAVATPECASPIRGALRRAPNVSVLMAAATDVDVQAREVVLDRGERLPYDSLVVACGAQTSYFGNDQWSEVSYGLKTLEDAVSLRNRVFGAFEEAERVDEGAARDAWMTFVIIGGGPTGVEMAGALAILRRHDLGPEFRRVDPRNARVILLDAGERLVSAFQEKLSTKVAEQLDSLGVIVHQQARVTAIDDQGVTVTIDGEEQNIAARTVVWAAGVRAVDFSAAVAAATGASADRGGRLPVGADLAIEGHPEISVIGDTAVAPGPGERPLPGLATVAIQEARHVAKGIASGKPGASGPFKYLDKGALAVVGRGKAVCEVRGRTLSGRPAFFMYLGVHLFYLSGGGPGHRIKVLIDWISARVGNPQSQIINGDLDTIERAPETG